MQKGGKLLEQGSKCLIHNKYNNLYNYYNCKKITNFELNNLKILGSVSPIEKLYDCNTSIFLKPNLG